MFRTMFLIAAMTLAGCGTINPLGPILQVGVMWKQGEATKYYATPQDELLSATRAALADLDIPVTDESHDGRTITVRAGDDDRFRIRVTAVRDRVSKLAVRVNTFGDRPYAELVFRHVDKQEGVEQFMSVGKLNEAVGAY